MDKRWKEIEYDPGLAEGVASDLNLPMPVVGALIGRGLCTVEQIDHFLHPRLSRLSDPFGLPGMEEAVVRLWDAIDAAEMVVVFGDYDVDGVSSTALLVSFLSDLGAIVSPYLPNRMLDGYGFNKPILERCISELRPSLIVTVDCGTGSVDAVTTAGEAGIDVIVTDHHEPSDEIADALALVNPKLGGPEETRMLAGVGVAFKLCHGMLKKGRADQREIAESTDLRPYMDLVALGTVADIVPLVGENRILAHYGLKRMSTPRCLGLKTLIDIAGIKDDVQAHHIGFQLGPRLNAAGRMGDAHAALELLLTQDEDRAKSLAMKLDHANRERQEVESRISNEARADANANYDPEVSFALVIAKEGWHPGVIGIVASRLAQQYLRPAIIIGIDEDGVGRGSCRSIEGFDLVAALTQCDEYLIQYGGHTMAAGLEIKHENVDAFREAFNRAAVEALADKELRPTQRIDAWLGLGEIDNWLFDSQQVIRPFGHSNPSPVWASSDLRVVRHRVVGRGHLQMTVASGGVQLDAIGFGLGEREVPAGPIDLAFQLKKNFYMGRETLRLDIQDFRVAPE